MTVLSNISPDRLWPLSHGENRASLISSVGATQRPCSPLLSPESAHTGTLLGPEQHPLGQNSTVTNCTEPQGLACPVRSPTWVRELLSPLSTPLAGSAHLHRRVQAPSKAHSNTAHAGSEATGKADACPGRGHCFGELCALRHRTWAPLRWLSCARTNSRTSLFRHYGITLKIFKMIMFTILG